jgi:hypothetical protein
MNLTEIRKGSLGLLTENGLNKFDRQEVKVYKQMHGDSTRRTSNVIHFEFEDSKARMDNYISKLVKRQRLAIAI